MQIIKDSHLRDHAPFHVDLEYRRQPTRIEEPPEYWNFDLFAMAKTEAWGVKESQEKLKHKLGEEREIGQWRKAKTADAPWRQLTQVGREADDHYRTWKVDIENDKYIKERREVLKKQAANAGGNGRDKHRQHCIQVDEVDVGVQDNEKGMDEASAGTEIVAIC